MIVVGQKERIGAWVAEQIGNTSPWHGYEAIGIERDGELVGGVVIDNYLPGGRCSVHCAGRGQNWLTREFLRVVFVYVFRQLDCNVVLNIVSCPNHASMRFTRHLGFRCVHIIERGGRGGADAALFELKKADCRWIGDEHE